MTLSIMTFRITTFRIPALSITIKNVTLSITTLYTFDTVMLSVLNKPIMLNVVRLIVVAPKSIIVF